jgi:hypothetical protein
MRLTPRKARVDLIKLFGGVIYENMAYFNKKLCKYLHKFCKNNQIITYEAFIVHLFNYFLS